MALLASTFLDHSLALQLAPVFQPSSLPDTLILAQQSSPASFSSKSSAPKSKPRPWTWLPLFPAPSQNLKPFSDGVDDDAHQHEYHSQQALADANPSPQASPKTSPKIKSGGSKKRVVFTPEMARQLRKQLHATDSFHDFMYHSSIASRLASHDS